MKLFAGRVTGLSVSRRVVVLVLELVQGEDTIALYADLPPFWRWLQFLGLSEPNQLLGKRLELLGEEE